MRTVARLTPFEPPAYNRAALPQIQRGAPRRKREEDLPAKYPEAGKDPRLPRTHGHAGRARRARGPSSQGAQGPERLVRRPGGRTRRSEGMSTVKSGREIDTIFRTATRVVHPLLILLIARTPAQHDQSGRVAFIAGKRLGGAVWRNRCRRVMRETVRRAPGPWPGHDIALIARAGVATASPAELDVALASALGRSGISP